MNAVSVNHLAQGPSNYDLLADALNGLYIDGDDSDDMTLNRLEISLQQKVKAVIDGEYPLTVCRYSRPPRQRSCPA